MKTMSLPAVLIILASGAHAQAAAAPPPAPGAAGPRSCLESIPP